MDFKHFYTIAVYASAVSCLLLQNDTSDNTASFPQYPPTNSTPFVSSIWGPSILAISYTWSQVIIPTIVGTVIMTVDEATNQTIATTVYHSEYQTNSSISIMSRPNTNAAGTQTTAVEGFDGRSTTIAYPTPYLDLDSMLVWTAALPTVDGSTRTCCSFQSTSSSTPAHASFTAGYGSTDQADPSGWLYGLVGAAFGDPDVHFSRGAVSSFWPDQPLTIPYMGCPHTWCQSSAAVVVGPAAAATTEAFLLETTKITVSSAVATHRYHVFKTPSSATTMTAVTSPAAPRPTSDGKPSSTPTFKVLNPSGTGAETSAVIATEKHSSTTRTKPEATPSAPETAEPRTTARGTSPTSQRISTSGAIVGPDTFVSEDAMTLSNSPHPTPLVRSTLAAGSSGLTTTTPTSRSLTQQAPHASAPSTDVVDSSTRHTTVDIDTTRFTWSINGGHSTSSSHQSTNSGMTEQFKTTTTAAHVGSYIWSGLGGGDRTTESLQTAPATQVVEQPSINPSNASYAPVQQTASSASTKDTQGVILSAFLVSLALAVL